MADAQAVLAFTIEAHDKATQVLRGLSTEVSGLSAKIQQSLRGVGAEQAKLSSAKRIELVTAQQQLALERYRVELEKLNKEIAISGVRTDEQTARRRLLNAQIGATTETLDRGTAAHQRNRHALDIAAAGFLGFGATAAGASIKAAISFDKLQRSVEGSTGLSGVALNRFTAQIRDVSRSSEFTLEQVAPVMITLRQRFGEVGAVAGKQAENILVFAKATGQDANQAVQDLSRTMRMWNMPAAQMGTTMDQLLTLFQRSGQPIDRMLSSFSRIGPQLQAMGFSFNQTMDLMGAFAKAGLDTDAVTRGLSRGLQQAAKDVGVTNGQVGGGIPVLGKYKNAMEAARAKMDELQAKTTQQGYNTEQERTAYKKAQQQLDVSTRSYDALSKVIGQAGGAHATIGRIIQAEFTQILNATNQQDRLNASIALFGGRAGPQFARALQDGKVSLQEVQQMMDQSKGSVDRYAKVLEQGPEAQWQRMKNQIRDLGISFGQDLLPAMQGALHVFTALAGPIETFIKDNKQLVEIMGGVGGTAALFTLLARHSPVGGALSRTGLGQTKVGQQILGGGGGSIWGIRGSLAPGSETNPIVVTMLGASALPGVGGKTGGKVTKEAERVAERDLVAEAEAAAGGAGEVGLLAKLKGAGDSLKSAGGLFSKGATASSIFKGLLGRAGSGIGIGLGGEMVSQLAGGLIGGKTGKDVSAIGGDISMGAGLGMLAGPEGAMAGAVVGAVIGGITTLFKSPSVAEKVGASLGQVSRGLIGAPHSQAQSNALATADSIGKHVTDLLNQANKLNKQVIDPRTGQLTKIGPAAGSRGAARQDILLQAAGQWQAGALENTLGTFSHIDPQNVITLFDKQFEGANKQRMRDAGAKHILAWVEEMQSQGKLTAPHAVTTIMKALEAKFPDLNAKWSAEGIDSVKALNAALNFDKTKKTIADSTTFFKTQWSGMPPLALQVGQGISTNLINQLKYLEQQTHSHSKATKDAALSAYRQLHDQAIPYFQGLAAKGALSMQDLQAAVELGIGNSAALLNTALKAMHAPMVTIGKTSVVSPIIGAAPSLPTSSTPGGATGLRVPGSAGPDNWTLLDPSGNPAARVAGGELLVSNRHTEAKASVATMAVYGKTLGQMVAGETTPHAMATGGVIRGPVSTFGPPGEAAGGTAYNRSTSEAGIAVNPHGGSNYNDALARSFGHRIALVTIGGHSARLPVIDKGPSAIGKHGPRLIDVTGAGARAMGINPADFPTDAIGTADFGGGGTVGGTSAYHLPRAFGSGGALGRLGAALVNKFIDAANNKLDQVAASQAGPIGGGPTPRSSGVQGVGTFDGIPVADWIIPELQYAQAHGWKGQITSGYRPGYDRHTTSGHSEHEGTQYPHGAVDFGGYGAYAERAEFFRHVAGYAGPKLIPAQFPGDGGHSSGTGYAHGGRINYAGAFGAGGAVTANKPTMALFGEKGAETAIFLPHMGLGGKPVTVAPKGAKGTKGQIANQLWNPFKHDFESMTAAQHRALVNRYIQQYHRRPPTGPSKGHSTAHDIGISLPGFGEVGTETVTKGGAINLGGDMKKMTNAAWTKIVNAVDKSLQSFSPEKDEAFISALSADMKKHPKNKRLQDLAGKALDALGNAFQAQTDQLSAEATLSQKRTQLTLRHRGLDPNSSDYQQAVIIDQLAASKALTTRLTGEDSSLRSLDAQARRQHNKALIDAVHKQLLQVDSDLADAQLNTLDLQDQFQQALKDATKAGIDKIAAALDEAAQSASLQSQISEAQQELAGVDMGSLQALKDKQGGSLTPEQIGQAQSDLGQFVAGQQAQIGVIQQQMALEPQKVGAGEETQGQANVNLLQDQLNILNLQVAIKKQTDATKDLTTATDNNTNVQKQFGGAVAFSYQGQDYVPSMSSNTGQDIGVGI